MKPTIWRAYENGANSSSIYMYGIVMIFFTRQKDNFGGKQREEIKF